MRYVCLKLRADLTIAAGIPVLKVPSPKGVGDAELDRLNETKHAVESEVLGQSSNFT